MVPLPESTKKLALRRQLAAVAVRMGMRNGKSEFESINWVIALITQSTRAFANTRHGLLSNGDELYLWQFKEIVRLALQDDFVARRQLQIWLRAEDARLFDARWGYPLHLVEGCTLEDGDAEKGDD